MEGCLVPPYKDRDWTVWTTLLSWCFIVLSFGWSSLRVLPGLKWTMMLCLGKILLRFSERPPELHLKLLLSPICWLRVSLHRSVAVEWNGWGHLQWASWSSEGPQWRSHLSGFQPWWWTAALWWERQGACLDKIWSCLSCCKYSVRNVSKVCDEFLCTITFLFSFFNIHDFSWPNLYEKCLGFSNTVSWDCKYTFLCQCSVGMFSYCILCKFSSNFYHHKVPSCVLVQMKAVQRSSGSIFQICATLFVSIQRQLNLSSLISGSDVVGRECVSCCSVQVAPSLSQRLDHRLCLDPRLCGKCVFHLL